MRVRDLGAHDKVVFGEHVGWVLKRRDVTHLLTGTQDIALDDDDEVRAAMPLEKAKRLLKELATAGSGTTVDELTMREIGGVLKISQRALRRIIARADGSSERLEGPEDFKDHDYMGVFDVGEELIVADRCYVGETKPLLARVIPALPGRWHVYIRQAVLHFDVSVAMFAVHEAHFKAATMDGDELGMFGVDSGCAVIVDGRARARADMLKEDREWHEGLIEDLGCFAWTAVGDGLYPVRTVTVDDRAAVVRASLAGPDEAYFQAPAGPKAPPTKKYTKAREQKLAAAGEARAYSPKTRFAVGERVAHAKFGEGVVSALLPDGKVTLDFPDGPRTLVHGR